jgi:SAM-dependent methyltransferase
MPKQKGKDKKRKSTRTIAQTADRYKLYLKAVQAPEHEVDFFNRVYKREYGSRPKLLREDFCGTYAICCEWVKSHKDCKAIGVDLDPEPLAWGQTHNFVKLKDEQQKRVTIYQADVREVNGTKADVLAAENFSFWIFKTRPALLEYFKAAYANLKSKGVMVLDMMGGPECLEENHEDITEYKKFDYVWEQARFDPITHDALFHIHFRFKDGSEMKRAFTYDWRMWSIPEVRELLAEAGFKRTDVYWEGTDKKTGEGNDVYTRRKHAPSDQAWIAYIVAAK